MRRPYHPSKLRAHARHKYSVLIPSQTLGTVCINLTGLHLSKQCATNQIIGWGELKGNKSYYKGSPSPFSSRNRKAYVLF